MTQAQTASLKSTLAAYKEELEVNLVEVYDDANNVNCVGEAIKQYIPNMDDDDLEQFVIYKGKLMYIGENEERANVAKSLEIESGSAVTQDIVKVTDVLNKICSTVTPPADDTQPTPAECIGTRLYDKNNQNSTNWRLVIEYSNSNVEKARYGSGWFLLKSGTELSDGSNVNNDYVINYATNEMILLSNYKEWTLSSQLAVTDGIVLNVDAKNLSNGAWTGVVKHGDVHFDSNKNSLYFDGNEDYLEITKAGDFSHGFTFEMYMNLERLRYNNGSNIASMGLFCKVATLDTPYPYAMRFGWDRDNYICKFYDPSSWTGTGSKLSTSSHGSVDSTSIGYGLNEDAYITFVYRRYDDTPASERTALGWTSKLDRVEYYVNGTLYGYTYYAINTYNNGLAYWGDNTAPFWVGVCMFHGTGSGRLYYLKGNVYSCRLYNKSISSTEVKDNYDSTVQFRSSGL